MKVRVPHILVVYLPAMLVLLLTVGFALMVLAQQNAGPSLDALARSAVIDELELKLPASYVAPDVSQNIVQALRTAQRSGQYDGDLTAKQFAEKLNSTLLTASHDKHLQVFHDPIPAVLSSPDAPRRSESRERSNFGFNKLERLRGNVGYLEILSFQPVDRAADSAGTCSVLWQTSMQSFWTSARTEEVIRRWLRSLPATSSNRLQFT